MNLKNAQLDVDNWIKEHGVRYFNELTNMAQLTEEVGEVARIIARRYGEQSEKESDKNKDLGEELADVIFVVLPHAIEGRIGRIQVFGRSLALNTLEAGGGVAADFFQKLRMRQVIGIKNSNVVGLPPKIGNGIFDAFGFQTKRRVGTKHDQPFVGNFKIKVRAFVGHEINHQAIMCLPKQRLHQRFGNCHIPVGRDDAGIIERCRALRSRIFDTLPAQPLCQQYRNERVQQLCQQEAGRYGKKNANKIGHVQY